ncbi:MAG: type II toxin-antitoxin system prevent-host-death family antitoxin [Lachnospiraceae bacterium]|nr:type II toxin-antitoxin system prevent-host-death family antitoxin [Lachnospiraceae bacterium]
MVAANYTAVRNNLKDYCDKASDEGEIVLVTRKAGKNVVIMSLDRLNQIEKELRNARYLAKIERGFAQIEAGQGVTHELIED